MKIHIPILVIGGGAAGMIAAWRASSLGAKVILDLTSAPHDFSEGAG